MVVGWLKCDVCLLFGLVVYSGVDVIMKFEWLELLVVVEMDVFWMGEIVFCDCEIDVIYVFLMCVEYVFVGDCIVVWCWVELYLCWF